MRQIDLDELHSLARQASGITKIYLHWSAGHYGQFFDDYHINIDSDGSIYASTDDLTEHLSHTYHRNSNAVGVSLACCVGATTDNLGDEPPTPDAIDAMAKVVAVLCQEFGLEITKDNVMTHGEAADNIDGVYASEPYGCQSTVERWDLQYLGTDESPVYIIDYNDPSTGGNVLRGKAIWWQQQGV